MKTDPEMNKNRFMHAHWMHVQFGRFAALVSTWLGSAWTFAAAGLMVVLWLVTGPIFHFSPAWSETVGTGTGIATFLMVLLIQNAQNRDARALHLKLNEIILAMDKAGNHMIDIEQLSDQELDAMQGAHKTMKRAWSRSQKQNSRRPTEK